MTLKTISIFVALLLLLAFRLKSQDIITRTNGDKIESIILKYTEDTIVYRIYGDSSGIVHGLNTSQVSSVVLKTLAKKSNSSLINEKGVCDIITKTNGDQIFSLVQKVEGVTITYKLCGDSLNKTYTINEEYVRYIIYKDGSKDNFNLNTTPSTSIIKDTEQPKQNPLESTANSQIDRSQYIKGMSDAKLYYKSYRTAGTLTFLATFLGSPLYGLVPAILFSSMAPKPTNYNCPTQSLLSNADYYNGYHDQVKKIKSRKVWTNYFIGVGGYLILDIIYNSLKK